jgi:hypothetical protein
LKINKTIKPWIFKFKAFFVFCIFGFVSSSIVAQNILEKTIQADSIDTISINGNQIFTIRVSTSKTDIIKMKSTLDGEYQNQFQIISKQENHKLNLNLEQVQFTAIADDKRNAHKVIAATLTLETPENLNINVISDIGSVDLTGNFDLLSVELLQGQCDVRGSANLAIINTIDGDISVITESAIIDANSSRGNVILDEFPESNSAWNLESINGNIKVVKQE